MTHRVVRLLLTSLAFGALLGAPPANALDTGDIVVVSLSGEVHVTMGGAERPVHEGSVLELPATLRTGRDGAVELRQGATSVSIGPDTLLEFPALEIAGGPIDRIVQPRGNAFYSVGKRGGRKLRVETPILVGVVKGTQFNVAVQPDSSTISLFEGLLEIRAADDSSVVEIKAGEIAARHRGDANIGVMKMDAKAPPHAPPASRSPPASPGAASHVDRAPAAVSSAPAADDDDKNSSLAGAEVARGFTAVVEPPMMDHGNSVAPGIGGTAGIEMAAGAPAGGVSIDAAPAMAVAADIAASADVGGSTASIDPGITASVDAGSAAGIDAGSATTDVAAGVVVDVPLSNLDLGATVGGADPGAIIDLGDVASPNQGNAGEGNNGNGKGNAGAGSLNSGSANEVDVDSVLNGLLKKPGKK